MDEDTSKCGPQSEDTEDDISVRIESTRNELKFLNSSYVYLQYNVIF